MAQALLGGRLQSPPLREVPAEAIGGEIRIGTVFGQARPVRHDEQLKKLLAEGINLKRLRSCFSTGNDPVDLVNDPLGKIHHGFAGLAIEFE